VRLSTFIVLYYKTSCLTFCCCCVFALLDYPINDILARDKSVQIILKAIGNTSLCKDLLKEKENTTLIEKERKKTSLITLVNNIFDQTKHEDGINPDRCMMTTMQQRRTGIFLSLLHTIAHTYFRTKDDVLITLFQHIEHIDTKTTAEKLYLTLVEKLLFKYLASSNWNQNAKKGGAFALLSRVNNLWGGSCKTWENNSDKCGEICSAKSSVPSGVALQYIVHLITDYASPSSASLQMLIEFFKAGFNQTFLSEPVIQTKDLNFLNRVLSAPLDILSKAISSALTQQAVKIKTNHISTVLAMLLPQCWLEIVTYVTPEITPNDSLETHLPGKQSISTPKCSTPLYILFVSWYDTTIF
jgi:hypothetical protein